MNRPGALECELLLGVIHDILTGSLVPAAADPDQRADALAVRRHRPPQVLESIAVDLDRQLCDQLEERHH